MEGAIVEAEASLCDGADPDPVQEATTSLLAEVQRFQERVGAEAAAVSEARARLAKERDEARQSMREEREQLETERRAFEEDLLRWLVPCFERERRRRPTALQALADPWFKGGSASRPAPSQFAPAPRAVPSALSARTQVLHSTLAPTLPRMASQQFAPQQMVYGAPVQYQGAAAEPCGSRCGAAFAAPRAPMLR